MLARIGQKHARLSRIARIDETTQDRRNRGRVTSGRRAAVVAEVERERARIARELHAGAGQPLAGIKINLELLENGLHEKWQRALPEETQQALERLNRLAEAALGQVRAVSHRLHPPDWQERSVREALELLVAESGIEGKCETSLELAILSSEPPHQVKVVLYRCAQECLSNVIRHSGATRFRLALSESDTRMVMDVSDNGQGIPGDAAKSGGIGLASIREHAESLGGDVSIVSGRGGTTIRVSLPSTDD